MNDDFGRCFLFTQIIDKFIMFLYIKLFPNEQKLEYGGADAESSVQIFPLERQ